MRVMTTIIIVVASLAGCMHTSSNTALPTATVQAYLPIIIAPSFEDQLLTLINARRGAQSLTGVSILAAVAEAHSQDMIDRNFFGHINPDGLDAGARLDAAGYKWEYWGELIGRGYTSPVAVFNGWMESSLHRAQLLNPDYSEAGIGYVVGGHYWTIVLTEPQ